LGYGHLSGDLKPPGPKDQGLCCTL
jgi:hypothetical protein